MADTEREPSGDESSLRPILAIEAKGLRPANLSQMEMPDLRWLSLDVLVINDQYQRSLSSSSLRSIRRIVQNFDWARLKALNVTPTQDGFYEVVDGQHTAIAAATHGYIDELPCLISATRDLAERAGDFVGLNKDRVAIHPLQLYRAELAAGDELALEVEQGVKSAGGRIIPSTTGIRLRPGDSCAIQALKKLANTGGPAYVKRIVGLAVSADLAPLTANMIAALAELAWEDEFSQVSDEVIVDTLRVYGANKLVSRAKELKSDTPGLPLKRAIAVVIARLARV